MNESVKPKPKQKNSNTIYMNCDKAWQIATQVMMIHKKFKWIEDFWFHVYYL